MLLVDIWGGGLTGLIALAGLLLLSFACLAFMFEPLV